LLQRRRNQGPPPPNLGARFATGTHLWFVDVDVVVAQDAARVLRASCGRTGAAAIIGSYDDRPQAKNFLSQYKNLVHHYYHHRGKQHASTFWAAAVQWSAQSSFELGGFDAERYRYPSIEDIDFGYRLRDAGGRIVLEPALQGRHLKEWRFVNLVHTEIFRRALPWSRLMLKRKDFTDDLNLGKGERARAVLALVDNGCHGRLGIRPARWLGVSRFLWRSLLAANIGFLRSSFALADRFLPCEPSFPSILLCLQQRRVSPSQLPSITLIE
jgi:GT2 family glycosyltransferase